MPKINEKPKNGDPGFPNADIPELIRVTLIIPPETPVAEIVQVFGEPPNEKGYTPNPGWALRIEQGQVLIELPFRSCQVQGLGITRR